MSYFGKPVRQWFTPASPSGAEVAAASLPTAAFSPAGTFAATRLCERLNRVRPAEQVGLVVLREAGQAVAHARFAVRRGSRCCQPSDRGVFTSGNFCRDAVTRAPESRPPSGAGRPCRISGSRSGSSARFAVRRGSRCCQSADRGVFSGGNFCRDAVMRAPESRPPSGAGRLCRTSGSRSGSGSRPLRRPAQKSLLPAFRPRRFQRRELSSRHGYASA